MSSSEDEAQPHSASRILLVSLVRNHPVVLGKSMLPNAVVIKEKAWQAIFKEYITHTGKSVTVDQLKKTLSNMKASVKRKADVRVTGNKKIKLLGWEKDFLECIQSEKNPVFCKVPGSLAVGTRQQQLGGAPSSQEASSESSQVLGRPSTEFHPSVSEQGRRRTGVLQRPTKRLRSGETEETAAMSTSDLQRLVLVEQLKLIRLQTKSEELRLRKMELFNTDDVPATASQIPSSPGRDSFLDYTDH